MFECVTGTSDDELHITEVVRVRCVFTTVDPRLGDKHHRQEPLKTLRKYRSAVDREEKSVWGSSPLFGVFLASESEGDIRAGDSVSIQFESEL